jgi:MOSC domain-containing protein YiiM
MTATVVGVSSKETPGIPKLPRQQLTLVAGHGVEGDYHAGALVRHRSRAAATPDSPNRRQVHLIHAELFDELAPLGIEVAPGQMGENITTRGLALLDLAPGAQLHIGASAVIEVTGVRNPCNQLDVVDERLLGQVAIKCADGGIVRKAGVMGVVVTGGVVRPGDPIRVETPAGAAGTLQPV